jgi:hypothetical protein
MQHAQLVSVTLEVRALHVRGSVRLDDQQPQPVGERGLSGEQSGQHLPPEHRESPRVIRQPGVQPEFRHLSQVDESIAVVRDADGGDAAI